ncbi:toll/interleukin-1 receptor domain-containing protein [Duganella sp. SG902]|uniref:toll/interleukin-1 receptor domain-containing protein n=1 Tax=Duganella sp. SG902 TaxID=2587016 RepID=UPI00159DB0B3
MAIDQSDLRRAAQRQTFRKSLLRAHGQRTAFLCHSHKDRELAEGLQVLLAEKGVELYIDWQDTAMPDKPNEETAGRIKLKIKNCDWFLFLATANSMSSRWCPWELGYADGSKPLERIAIVPTMDGLSTHGNEYVGIYRRIYSHGGELFWMSTDNKQATVVRVIPFL